MLPLVHRLQSGQRVLVHCSGGKGRALALQEQVWKLSMFSSETMSFFCWLLLQNSLMSWNCNFWIVLSECSSCSKKFLLWSNHFYRSSWHLLGTGTLVAALLMTSAGGHQSLCSAIASMRAVRPGMLKNPLQQLYLLHLRNCLLQIWCWRPPNRRLTYCKTQWEKESPKQSEARLLGGSTHLRD